jgi:hypothetical protein
MKRNIFVRTVINWLYNYAPIGGLQQQATTAAAEKKKEREEEEREREQR